MKVPRGVWDQDGNTLPLIGGGVNARPAGV